MLSSFLPESHTIDPRGVDDIDRESCQARFSWAENARVRFRHERVFPVLRSSEMVMLMPLRRYCGAMKLIVILVSLRTGFPFSR
jgi:hypothetical protein